MLLQFVWRMTVQMLKTLLLKQFSDVLSWSRKDLYPLSGEVHLFEDFSLTQSIIYIVTEN